MSDGIISQLEQLLESGYQVYFFSNPDNYSHLAEKRPFGIDLNFLDITKTGNREFYKMLRQVDIVAHNSGPLTAPNWVRLDCAILPGGYFGFALSADKCEDRLHTLLKVPDDYNGLVPVSEYIVIPKADGTWVSHTLGTAVTRKKIGLLSKVIGIKAWGIESYTGVSQYDNSAVRAHARLGPMQLLTAMTEVHDYPTNTFIYRQDVDPDRLENTIDNPPSIRPTVMLNSASLEDKVYLQTQIDRGKKVSIVYPGHVKQEDKLLVPIVEE